MLNVTPYNASYHALSAILMIYRGLLPCKNAAAGKFCGIACEFREGVGA